MVDALKAYPGSFAQDSMPWLAASPGVPGCQRLEGFRMLTLRHTPDSKAARDTLATQGLPWPENTGDLAGDLSGSGLLLMRRHAEEIVIISQASSPKISTALDALATALAPGQCSSAVAIDLTHSVTLVALEGPHLNAWLAHLVDAQAIPNQPGCASRARLADIPVALLRLSIDRLWLVADRAVSPYLANWLAFSHEGAFSAA